MVVDDVGEGRGERHVDHRGALVGEPGRCLLDQRLGLGFGLVPYRRAADPDARPPDVAIEADRRQLQHGGAEQRNVVERARHEAERIDRVALHLDADAREVAEGRLVAHHAAIGGRPDHRAAGLRAEGQWHVAVGHRRCGPGRRTAGRMSGIVRVGRGAGMTIGELRGHRLAHDDGIGGPAERHAGGIAERHLACEDRRVVAGRHVVGVDDVLHADRDAAQQATARRVGGLGLGDGLVGIEMGPGLHDAVALGDAIEIAAHQFLGGQRAGLDRGRGFEGGDLLHDSTLRAHAAMSSRPASSC